MNGLRKIRLVCICFSTLTTLGMAGITMASCGETEPPPESPTSTSTTLDEGLDYTFTFSREIPKAASLYSTYLVPWTLAVEEASNGRVTIERTELGGLEKEDAIALRQVLDGRADLAVLAASWAPGEYPLLELAELPMLFPDTEVAARVTLQLIEEYGEEEFEGLHVLGFMTTGFYQYFGNAPVRAPADLAGLDIKTFSDSDDDIVAALGAVPWSNGSPAPVSDPPILQMDGMFVPWPVQAQGNPDFWGTYWTSCDLFLRPLLLVMNQDKWDSLPAAVQAAFTDSSGVEASVKYLADDAKYNYDNSLMPELGDRGYDYRAIEERARELGHPIYVLSEAEKAEWREALLPVWDNWVLKYTAVLPTRSVLDRALELVEEYSAD